MSLRNPVLSTAGSGTKDWVEEDLGSWEDIAMIEGSVCVVGTRVCEARGGRGGGRALLYPPCSIKLSVYGGGGDVILPRDQALSGCSVWSVITAHTYRQSNGGLCLQQFDTFQGAVVVHGLWLKGES